jgi:hypothetical protein
MSDIEGKATRVRARSEAGLACAVANTAYAPASASILFPGFRFAAERRDFPRPTRKKLAASRRKVRACEPLSASRVSPASRLRTLLVRS